MEIEGFDTPRQCHLCGHHFMLKPKVLIVGVKMEDYPNGR